MHENRAIVDDEEDGKFHCDVIKKYKVDDNTEISWQYVNELYITIWKRNLLYLQVEHHFLDSNKLREMYRLGLIDDYKAFSRKLRETFPQTNIFRCCGTDTTDDAYKLLMQRTRNRKNDYSK